MQHGLARNQSIFLKWNFLLIFGLKKLGETQHTLLVYWVANVPLKEMNFHTAFS
jgi:hypothetical protein